MGNFLDILFFAAIAVFIAVRLVNMLGSEDEDDLDRVIRTSNNDLEVEIKEVKEERVDKFVVPDKLHNVENQIRILKNSMSDFRIDEFIMGAKKAYEYIVRGFNDHNRKLLGNLLAKPLFDSFEKKIAKEEQKEIVAHKTLVSIDSALIDSVHVADNSVSIQVKFLTEQINYTMDKTKKILSGSNSRIEKYDELWTFQKPLNGETEWKLVKIS